MLLVFQSVALVATVEIKLVAVTTAYELHAHCGSSLRPSLELVDAPDGNKWFDCASSFFRALDILLLAMIREVGQSAQASWYLPDAVIAGKTMLVRI